MADSTQENLHAIFIAIDLHGHVNPAVQMAIKLALKGFTITFIVPDIQMHQDVRISSQSELYCVRDFNIFNKVRSSLGVDIRYVTVSLSSYLPADSTGPQNFYGTPSSEQFQYNVFYNFGAQLEAVVGKIVSSSCDPPVKVVIADTFYPWISKIAQKYDLVQVSFWTQPALVFVLYSYVELLRQNGHVYCQEKREDAIDYIPGVRAVEPKDLISYFHEEENSTIVHKIVYTAFDDVKQNADFVLSNTIHEFEPETISVLQSTGMSFYSVGPLFPLGFTESLVQTSGVWTETSCTDWLNTKSQGSVLYMSFGSLAIVSKDEIAEIAYGLLHSNVNFVWVLRPGTDASESDTHQLLPADLKEDLTGLGLIVPWTFQRSVLSHPAIGGFLTHCGWNSILESIWCKVPMLCFPQFTDQPTNRKLVVDDWKIGINLCHKMPIRMEETSESIKLLMSQASDGLRKNISELSLIMENALKDDGSSVKNLDLFIQNLKMKIAKET